MTRFVSAIPALLLLAACDVAPKSVAVCENVSILPALHDPDSYDRLHYRIVPSAENTVDVRITYRAKNDEGRTFKETEICNLPKDAAFDEQEARAHLEEQKRKEVKLEEKEEGPTIEELQKKYHDRKKAHADELLQADDEEGKAILRELQELMTIKKEGYGDVKAQPVEADKAPE